MTKKTTNSTIQKQIVSKYPDIQVIRHSLAHIMALALQRLYKNVQFGVGPDIDNGFYYDVFTKKPITIEDLPKIEAEMKNIIKENLPFSKFELSINNGKNLFKKLNQKFKLELIDDLKNFGTTNVSEIEKLKDLPKKKIKGDKSISVYVLGENIKKAQAKSKHTTNVLFTKKDLLKLQDKNKVFVDLCRGPHIKSTKDVPDTFKLVNVAGAYWRGNEKNKMLTRIYGVAFLDKQEMDEYSNMLIEAEKRDHKKLGLALDIFFLDDTAPGMPYWLPNGVIILNELLDFWRKEHKKRGYLEIMSPLLNKKQLYEISGHWDHYKDKMFIIEDQNQGKNPDIYCLKPMNCPNAMIVYKHQTHSYRDLPLRYSDCDVLHRNEKSGELSGLLRVSKFIQDDAHIFVSLSQIKSEIQNILDIAKLFYSVFNIKFQLRLGTRPKDFMGNKKDWDKAEADLKEVLDTSGLYYYIGKGEGAFYGPKIDIMMQDCLNRDWQLGTIQLDFQIPKNFGLTYTDSDGSLKTPIVIHRVIYGSLERFMGILIEHFAGAFPLWLSPIQTVILPVGGKNIEYANSINMSLKAKNIRSEVWSNETLSKRIRNAELQKIPYIVVVGDKEQEHSIIAVRERFVGDLGAFSIEDFISRLIREIEDKIIKN